METTYTVQLGDTLASIASRYNVTVEQLVDWNNLTNPNQIMVGQVLVVVDDGEFLNHGLDDEVWEEDVTEDMTEDIAAKGYGLNWSGPGQGSSGQGAYQNAVFNGILYVFGTPRSTYQQGERIPISLKKTNVSNRTITLDYPTRQQFEFEALNRSGRVIWRYSQGRSFGWNGDTVVLRPGQSRTYRYTWDQRNNQGIQVVPQRLTLRGSNVARGWASRVVRTEIRIAGQGGGSNPNPPDNFPSGCQAGVNILRNPGFEQWGNGGSPRQWQGRNVARSTLRHGGSFGLQLGDNPSRQAELSQDVAVAAQRVYRLTFWARECARFQQSNFSLRTSVLYLDASGRVIGQSDPDYDQNFIPNERFSQLSFTTGRVPSGTRTARVRFVFTPRASNQNCVVVDDVFLECLV